MKKDDANLLCEYCGVAITLDDNKCPNCGANCSKIIKEYKDAQKKKEEEQQAILMDAQGKIINSVTSSFKVASKMHIFVMIIAGIVILSIIVMSLISFNNFKHHSEQIDNSNKKSDDVVNDNNTRKNISVKYNELAESDYFSIILDGYELYEHKADNEFFNDVCATKTGYQNIAFHFIIENTNSDGLPLIVGGFNNLDLKADDYVVEKAKLSVSSPCVSSVGKEKYEEIEGEIINANSRLQGYVGYEVPKDKKELKFSFDNVEIVMDNPVYEGA